MQLLTGYKYEYEVQLEVMQGIVTYISKLPYIPSYPPVTRRLLGIRRSSETRRLIETQRLFRDLRYFKVLKILDGGWPPS